MIDIFPEFEYEVAYDKRSNPPPALLHYWSLKASATWGDREYTATHVLSYAKSEYESLDAERMGETVSGRVNEALDALRDKMRSHYDDALMRRNVADLTELFLQAKGVRPAGNRPETVEREDDDGAPRDWGDESLSRARSVPPGGVFSAPAPTAPPPPPKPNLPPVDFDGLYLYEVESDQEEDTAAELIEVPDRSTAARSTKGDGEVAAEPDREPGDEVVRVLRTVLASASSYVDAYVRQSPDQSAPDAVKRNRERDNVGRILKGTLTAADAFVEALP